MELFRKFFDGILAKLGESVAAACGPFVATALAWLVAPASIAVPRWLVAAIVAVGTTLVVASYALGSRRGRRRAGTPRLVRIDTLQENILKLLWVHPHATVQFEVLVRMLKRSYNTVRLACERLHTRGFVAGNFYDTNTQVQLTNEGREYLDKRGLNERAEDFLLTQFRRTEIKEPQGH